MEKGILLASLLGFAVAGHTLTQDHPDHPKQQASETKAAETKAVVEATVVGENICLGCALKKEKGAAAQCDKYGHRHALKVTSVTAAGKEQPEMKGWVLHYLDTDKGQPFIKEHHGETLTLTGKVYSGERVLEVDKQEDAKKPDHPDHPKK
ncbi:MAG: hypothetical protein HY716_17180 [Planctomycetes bacterium]|nr:hypothetical protein [Planctomycetota bacterium]